MSTTITAAGPVIPEFHVGDRLAKSLHHAGVSIAEMALRIGVSRQTIGNYLAGRTAPKLAVLRVWAEETGVPLEWLATGRLTSGDAEPSDIPMPYQAVSARREYDEQLPFDHAKAA